ncbi:MAG: hypothetical protein M3340_13825, partial [Actinomycetota bacterium]|nr:hypothetical protein [Actinomycetota bacterium]
MLSATGASLLLLEDRPNPMVGSIGAVLFLDDPPPPHEEVVAQVESGLDRFPRLRHRLRGPAVPGARPRWAPDPSFDLRAPHRDPDRRPGRRRRARALHRGGARRPARGSGRSP